MGLMYFASKVLFPWGLYRVAVKQANLSQYIAETRHYIYQYGNSIQVP